MTVVAGSAVLLSLWAAALSAQVAPDTVVRLASRPVHAGVGSLERDLSIGVADGAEHYMIGGIGDIAVARNGTIYVFDRTVPTIRMYDERGTYVKSIGRRGGGPGEYQSGAALAIAKDGNLLMYDPGNARINVYTPEGAVVTHWRTGARGSGTAAGKGLLTVDVNGQVYIWLWYFIRPPSGVPEPKSGWLHFGDGVVKDTLHEPAFPKETLLTASAGGQVMNRVVPFAPMNLSRLSPAGYLVTGRTDRIAIDLHTSPNQVVSIRRPTRRLPVSRRERDSARASITAEFHKDFPQWSWNGPDIPALKPAYQGFAVDADGRIWVQLEQGPQKEDANSGDDVVMTSTRRAVKGRAAPPGGFGSACPGAGWMLYDVYEPSGRYLGQVKTPEHIEMVVMRGDFVWASACNADDVPVMVRYRIHWR